MFFSVVIPLYNKAYSIERCLKSVLAQTYNNFEVIIVNDGSIDDSLYLVKEKFQHEIHTKKIKLINQPNQGVSVARNNGIYASRFDFICFLDADDEWLPDFLSIMKALINDYPDGSLYSLAHYIQTPNSDLVKPKHGLNPNHRGYVVDFFKSSSRGSVAKSSKVCVKKSDIMAFNGFPEGVTAGEDLYVWIKLALQGKVVCDMSYCCIVHQEPDSSRFGRKNSIPYPLVYFSQRSSLKIPLSLHKYLFMIFYKHFFSSLISLNINEAYRRYKAYIKIFI